MQPSPLLAPPPVPPVDIPGFPHKPLADLIRRLTTTVWAPDGWQVVWNTEPLPFTGLVNGTLGAYIELGIRSSRPVGVDDYRDEYDEETQTNSYVYYGLRRFTLVLDCRSFAPKVPAWNILETLRLRLNNPRALTSRLALQAMGLTIIRFQPSVSLNYVDKGDVDTRMVTREVVDVELGWLSAAQVTDDAGTTIGTVGSVPDDSPDGTNSIPGTIEPPG